MLRTLVWVQRDPRQDIRLETVAERACMSPFHFHRVFREAMGETLDDHVRRLRLERAAHYLRLSPMPVSRLASVSGYGNHASFTRAFRGHFAESPVEYRDRFGLHPWTDIEGWGDKAFERLPFQLFNANREESRVEVLPPLRVAFVRSYGWYRDVSKPFARLARWASQRGLWTRDRILIGAPHDDPAVTPLNQVRFDACLVVPEGVEGDDMVGVQVLRGGDYATAVLEGCAATWEGKGQWLACSYARSIGRLVAKAPALELYLNDPIDTPPDKVLCRLFIPLGPCATLR